MVVRELIRYLQQQDPDARVLIVEQVPDHAEVEDIIEWEVGTVNVRNSVADDPDTYTLKRGDPAMLNTTDVLLIVGDVLAIFDPETYP